MQEQSISYGGSWSCGGGEIEAHFRPLFLDSPLRNWRLQRSFKENEQFETLSSSPCLGREPSLNGSNSSSGSNIPLSRENEGVFPIPTVSFNAVYQLCHIYRHLFDEGIGLRQLLDYYFVLRALHLSGSNSSNGSSSSSGGGSLNGSSSLSGSNSSNGSNSSSGGLNQAQAIERVEPHDSGIEQSEAIEPIEPQRQSMAQWAEGMGIAVKSNAEIMHTLGRFGMKKFASATMYVIAKVFANDDDNDTLRYDNWALRWPWMICEPDEKEGKFLLNEIMMAGNFGKYDTRISHETPSIPLFRGKKVPGQLWHAIEKTKHNFRLLTHYPEEVLCEPFFRLYHYFWRKLECGGIKTKTRLRQKPLAPGS